MVSDQWSDAVIRYPRAIQLSSRKMIHSNSEGYLTAEVAEERRGFIMPLRSSATSAVYNYTIVRDWLYGDRHSDYQSPADH